MRTVRHETAANRTRQLLRNGSQPLMGNSAYRILVVDDEYQVTRILQTTLCSHGYEVDIANHGDAALRLFHERKPDLIIADLEMPKTNCIELCEKIRRHSEAPIIVLSPGKDDETKVEALDRGADDCVTKPFSIEELLARIRANLRRTSQLAREWRSAGPIQTGDFHIDLESRVVLVRGQPVRLSPKQFDLLVYLLRNPNKVLSHRMILDAIWCGQRVNEPERLRVLINQVRKKIEPQATPQHILTEPWIGYRFQPEGAQPPAAAVHPYGM